MGRGRDAPETGRAEENAREDLPDDERQAESARTLTEETRHAEEHGE